MEIKIYRTEIDTNENIAKILEDIAKNIRKGYTYGLGWKVI